MHGLIVAELKRFAESEFGSEAWSAVLAQAGLSGPQNPGFEEVPDEQVAAIAQAGAKVAGMEPQALLEAFGAFLVPTLLTTYGAFVKSRWGALDLIEHTEETIHKAVRLRDANARPPKLKVTRRSDSELVVSYASPRQMCGVAVGIARGVGDHYGEPLAVRQTACMLRGAPSCEIVVRSDGA